MELNSVLPFQLATNLKTVSLRHHHIQQDQAWTFDGDKFLHAFADRSIRPEHNLPAPVAPGSASLARANHRR